MLNKKLKVINLIENKSKHISRRCTVRQLRCAKLPPVSFIVILACAFCYASANIKALETLGYAEHICNYLAI
jgi:hypothetical protein